MGDSGPLRAQSDPRALPKHAATAPMPSNSLRDRWVWSWSEGKRHARGREAASERLERAPRVRRSGAVGNSSGDRRPVQHEAGRTSGAHRDSLFFAIGAGVVAAKSGRHDVTWHGSPRSGAESLDAVAAKRKGKRLGQSCCQSAGQWMLASKDDAQPILDMRAASTGLDLPRFHPAASLLAGQCEGCV